LRLLINSIKLPKSKTTEIPKSNSLEKGISVYEKDATPWIKRRSSFRKMPMVKINIALTVNLLFEINPDP